MGKIVRCPECGEVYNNLEKLEDLRDNDGICLVCNAPIEVRDWDRVLASYEDDDLDGVDEDDDEDDWSDEEEADDDDEDFDDDDDEGFDEEDDDEEEEDDAEEAEDERF